MTERTTEHDANVRAPFADTFARTTADGASSRESENAADQADSLRADDKNQGQPEPILTPHSQKNTPPDENPGPKVTATSEQDSPTDLTSNADVHANDMRSCANYPHLSLPALPNLKPLTHPIHPTQLNAAGERSTVDGPIDLDQPRTPLATGGIVTSTRGFEKDEPETVMALSGRVVGSTHQGDKLVTSMARVGDRVEATLRGTLVDYDSELGHWTLETDGTDHVPWQIKLHWGQPFRLSPEARDVASLQAEVQRLVDENQRLRAHAAQLRKFAADLASAAQRVSREPSWLR